MNPSEPVPSPPGRRWQFRLSTILLAMVLLSVVGALGGGFLRADAEASSRSRLILLTLMAPLGLLAGGGLLRSLATLRKRRGRW